MAWSSNASISHLFYSHIITIANGQQSFEVKIPSIREEMDNSTYVYMLDLMSPGKLDSLKQIFKVQPTTVTLFNMLLCDPKITNVVEFKPITTSLTKGFTTIFPKFEIRNRKLYLAKDVEFTDEAWDEVVYIYQTALGMRIEKPPHFGPGDEAAKAFYERELAAKAKIAAIKAKNLGTSDKDGLMNVFVLVAYKFNYTFEQMYDMTMCQVRYLEEMTSNMIAYENGIMAYTAGNLKKAPKFFIK